jgi:hypothetical protein
MSYPKTILAIIRKHDALVSRVLAHGHVFGYAFGTALPMRELVLAFLLATLGCKHPGSAKLEGHWKGQKAEGIPESVQLPGNLFASGTEIIAQGNQIAIQTPAGRHPAATYFVDKEDATSLVIHTDRDGGAETFTFSEKADVMVWKVDAQRSITFKRVP